MVLLLILLLRLGWLEWLGLLRLLRLLWLLWLLWLGLLREGLRLVLEHVVKVGVGRLWWLGRRVLGELLLALEELRVAELLLLLILLLLLLWLLLLLLGGHGSSGGLGVGWVVDDALVVVVVWLLGRGEGGRRRDGLGRMCAVGRVAVVVVVGRGVGGSLGSSLGGLVGHRLGVVHAELLHQARVAHLPVVGGHA